MSFVSKLTVALAATSLITLAASAAHATVIIPKPVINIPKPVVHLPTVNVKPIVARPTPIVTPKHVPISHPENKAVKPITVPVANNSHPATKTPVLYSHHKAAPPPPPAPAKKVVLVNMELFPAFTDQNRVVKGYYDRKGGFHDMKSPSGRSTCTPTMGFQAPGGPVTRTGGPGAVAVPAVMCNTAA